MGLQKELQKWNKAVFGNIFEHKRDLFNRLEEVAHLLSITPSTYLENVHKKLWKDYEQGLAQEELLWYQTSRTKWIQHRDRNTRFFYGDTTVRRAKNTFDILQNNEGEWIGD